MNFREEAVELTKQLIESWDQDRDFEKVVVILEDYIIDMESKYDSKLKKLHYDLETARVM